MIRESKDILDWIVEQGVRFQPSLGGTLSLGRTNSFFLGGGRAMLNALYLHRRAARRRYSVRRRGGRARDRRRHVSVGRPEAAATASSRSARRDAGRGRRRVRGQHRMAEAILGRGRRQLPDPRHALQPRHDAEDAARPTGVQDVGDPTQCHAVAIDARAPEIRRRHHHAARLRGVRHRREQARASASTTRARTSGRSATRSGAGWSPRSPTRSPTSSSMRARATASCRRCFRRSKPDRSPSWRRKLELDPGGAGGDRRRLQRRGAARHLRPHHARRLPHRRPDAAEDALGAADRDAAFLRLSGAARHHLHLSGHAREQAGAHADERRQARREHVRRRRDHGRQRARARATPPASA